MKTHDEVVSDLDLFAEDVRANPYAHYRTLRDQGRAVYLSKLEMWAIPHYADVRSGLRDWSHLTSSRGVVFNERGNNAEVKRVNMIATDPPRHAELRAVIAKRVSPGVLRPAGEYIEHRADQTVAEMLAAEKCDVGAIARNFVVDVVGELVGLPAELAGEMAAWGEAAFDAAGPPNARCLAALPTLQKMDAGLSSLEEEDFRPGSLGRVAYEAARLGVIGLDEVVDVLHNFTKPSIDSTIAALATAIWQLSVSPQQWKLLRDDTTRAVAACNEALRFDAPVQMFTRVVQDECTIGGLTLRDGERVIMMFGSANRDERHYKDPDRFDLERNPTDHLAFGHGVHTCVGAPLARLEISKLLSAMAQRIQTLEADNEPTWRIGNLVRQIETMTIAVR